MNEQETRTNLILPSLQKAGWGRVQGSYIREEFAITKGRLMGNRQRGRSEKADYVLQYKNRNLAVIEAKARDKYYTEGVDQAKKYADKLRLRFTFCTNGEKIYQMDMHEAKEGEIVAYPTPDELWEMTFKHEQEGEAVMKWRDKLLSIPFEASGKWELRYYQENAITAVVEAIARGQQRILLNLATGTGKTSIAFQIVWKLFCAKWNIQKDEKRSPRILFLADRNILADQAFNAFSRFDEDALVRVRPDEIQKKGSVPKNGNIFFTIFQTFMSSAEDNAPYFWAYPKDFFDFIIIDECHRGGANDESTWRAIMDYFSPAVQLGLTATPKRDKNVDTYQYFGEPVYVYSLKDGINDGFLTPFRVKQISSSLDTYTYNPEDKISSGEIDKDREYGEYDFNRCIEIREREEARVKQLMQYIRPEEKTLVFCASQAHAALVRDLIQQHKKSSSPYYCVRVTANDGSEGENNLRAFQDSDKHLPAVLTTSKKLSTGVDAPEVRNIALLRPVYSMIEFKQIIGRGTRLFDGKDYFTIYDFVGAYNHFADPEWDGEPEGEIESEMLLLTPKPNAPKDDLIAQKKTRSDTQTKEAREMLRIKLADGKIRKVRFEVDTLFYTKDGQAISAEQFMNDFLRTLSARFANVEALNKVWRNPDSRQKLLDDLAEQGFEREGLENLQKILNAEASDLYDVLAYVAFCTDMITRTERTRQADAQLANYPVHEQAFLRFILQRYEREGVQSLSMAQLPYLLSLNYSGMEEAKTKLGDTVQIRQHFAHIQPYLYALSSYNNYD